MHKPISQAQILIAGPARNNADTLATEINTLIGSLVEINLKLLFNTSNA